MDLPIEEIGTVPIDQIDRESHVILPDGKQIVLLQLLEDGSYAQIRGDSVSKNVVFSQSKDDSTVRISNADSYQPAPSIPTSQYDNQQAYNDQKTEIDGRMSQDSGINIKQYHPTSQEDVSPEKVSEVKEEVVVKTEQSAERRRRSSMKQGFDHLETLLNETMANTPGHTVPTKISKAGLLMKAKDTIIRHQMEKKRKQQEIDLLRRECENLQQQISCAQEQLPETGYPLSKVRSDKNQREFLQYVAARTEQNYKFFPFYLIMKRMFESYNQVVAVQDAAKFRRTSQEWLQHSCSLPHVRPAVSDATRYISTDTCIFRPNADFPADCVRKVHEFLKESSKY